MPLLGRAGCSRAGTGRSALTIALAATALALPAAAAAAPVGSEAVQSTRDTNPAGVAEAFKAVASASTSVNRVKVYLDASSTAGRVELGLYSGSTKPGTKLGGCVVSAPKTGWNSCGLTSAIRVTVGTSYWTTVLQPRGTRRNDPLPRQGKRRWHKLPVVVVVPALAARLVSHGLQARKLPGVDLRRQLDQHFRWRRPRRRPLRPRRRHRRPRPAPARRHGRGRSRRQLGSMPVAGRSGSVGLPGASSRFRWRRRSR